MQITLEGVSKGRRGAALPEASVSYRSGIATLAVAETEQRPTVLGLIASGRMRPDTGSVTIDGTADASALRRAVALVDAPDVCDPAPNVSVAGLVGEELMFAGGRADPISARRWLDALGYRDLAGTAIADVPATVRLRILCELALLRSGVDGIVVVSPDRHGGEPLAWWRLMQEYADRGIAVLVIAGRASEWAIDHQDAIAAVAATQQALGAALGEFDERQAAWAQSGGAALPGADEEERA
jgi:hypothetical protein